MLDHLNETIAHESALAAELLWSVPVISGFLLTGSWMSLMGSLSAIGGHAAKGADVDAQRRAQSELKFESDMIEKTKGLWTETAGSMGRNLIDNETQSKSAQVMSDIDAFGKDGVFGAKYQKGLQDNTESLNKTASQSVEDSAETGQRGAQNNQNDNLSLKKFNMDMNGKENAIEQKSEGDSTSMLNKTKEGVERSKQIDSMVENGRFSDRSTAAAYLNEGTVATETSDALAKTKLLQTEGRAALEDSAVGSNYDKHQSGVAYLNNLYENGAEVVQQAKNAQQTMSTLAGLADSKILNSVDHGDIIRANMTKQQMAIGDAKGFQSMADKHFDRDTVGASEFLANYKNESDFGKTEMMKKFADEKFNGDVSAASKAVAGAGISYVNNRGELETIAMAEDGRIGHKEIKAQDIKNVEVGTKGQSTHTINKYGGRGGVDAAILAQEAYDNKVIAAAAATAFAGYKASQALGTDIKWDDGAASDPALHDSPVAPPRIK